MGDSIDGLAKSTTRLVCAVLTHEDHVEKAVKESAAKDETQSIGSRRHPNTFTMPVFSELLFIMWLKEVKRCLRDSMKSASPLSS